MILYCTVLYRITTAEDDSETIDWLQSDSLASKLIVESGSE